MRLVASFVLNQELRRFRSYPIYMDYSYGLRAKGHKKVTGEHVINWGSKTLPDLDFADDLRILDESVIKKNEFFEILRFRGARISLKINYKKTASPRLGISEGEDVMMGNEKIFQVESFTYLASIIIKDGGCT